MSFRKTRRGLKIGQPRAGFKAFAMRRTPQRFRRVPQRATRFNGPRKFPVLNPRIGGFLGIEVKFYDQKLIDNALTAPTDATGGEHDPSATVLLNTVTQGDGESQRDGRKITMRSIYVDGIINCAKQASQSSGDNATGIFIALVLDTQTNGATISSEDVFVNAGGNALTAATPFRNLQFTKRFKVLATRRFIIQDANMANATSFSADSGIIANGVQKRFKMFKNLNIETQYSGTTETVANITDNSLHIVAWCTDTGMAPKISYSSRLRYVG